MIKLQTRITKTEPGVLITRGVNQAELIKYVPFIDAVYLLLKGEFPDAPTSRALNAISFAMAYTSLTPSYDEEEEYEVEEMEEDFDDMEEDDTEFELSGDSLISFLEDYPRDTFLPMITMAGVEQLITEKAKLKRTTILKKIPDAAFEYIQIMDKMPEIRQCLLDDKIVMEDPKKISETQKKLQGILNNLQIFSDCFYVLGFEPLEAACFVSIVNMPAQISRFIDSLPVADPKKVYEPNSYSELLCQFITGEEPFSPGDTRMLEALVVACLDHGKTAPSVVAAMNAASVRAKEPDCLNQGLRCITQLHGGAGQSTAIMLQEIMEQIKVEDDATKITDEQLSKAATEYIKSSKKRLPGWGHRLHKKGDPRAKALFELADSLSIPDNNRRLAKIITQVFKQEKGKELPLNVDGAIGAIVSDLELEPYVAFAVFTVGRLAGISAHMLEELTYPPMRSIIAEYEYVGAEQVEIPKRYLKNKELNKDG